MNKEKFLIFILYINFIMIAFIVIFAVGCITFNPDMQEWIYRNWDFLRSKAIKFNLEQFKQRFKDEILQLGIFAFTICIGLSLNVVAILKSITFKKFTQSIVSQFALIFIVYSSAWVIISFKANFELHFIQFPQWITYSSITFGIILTIFGCIGYLKYIILFLLLYTL